MGARHYDAELYRIKGELLLTQAVADEGGAEACFQNGVEGCARPKREVFGAAGGDELEPTVAEAR